jgi:glutaredoxin
MLTIYSKENCIQCNQAKQLLTERGIRYDEIRVDLDPTARQFLLDSGHRSVPQIYKDGKLFVEGGVSGLRRLADTDFARLKDVA